MEATDLTEIEADDRIRSVDSMTIRALLPSPVNFGDWIMRHRDFVLVRVRTADGAEGWSFTLTRDAPVAAVIRQSVRPGYEGKSLAPTVCHERTRRSNLSTFSAGVGLRALSVVDLAVWDALGKRLNRNITDLLGGVPTPLPATAIIGYPPTMDAEAVRAQVVELHAAGWRRFKLAAAATPELTAQRHAAVLSVATDVHVALDAAWTLATVEEALELLAALDQPLGWLEDAFPPGDAGLLAALRRATSVPIAMGDEQGGSYYPEALLRADAVDIVRLDLTCMGGLTAAPAIIRRCHAAGVQLAPHMNAHVHSRTLPALGMVDPPIEWGVPWTGVDPFADSLEQPVVVDGRMRPLGDGGGFGRLVAPEWIVDQSVLDDVDGVMVDVARAATSS